MPKRDDTIPPELEAFLPLPKEIFRDHRGRPIVTRDEWERFSRWRKLRDVLLGWDPREPRGWLY